MKCIIHEVELVGDQMSLRCPVGDHNPTVARAALGPANTQGCVCPPGANLTCNNPVCPRGGAQPFKIT